MMALKDKSSRLAIGASIFMHLLLLLIFLVIKLNLKIEIPEFTEITFVSGKNRISATPSIREYPPPSPSTLETKEEASEIVKLPARKMLEPEEPQLRTVDQSKQTPNEEILNVPEIEHTNNRKSPIESILKNPTINEKEVALPSETIAADDKLLPTSSIATDVSGETPYQIEGQAASRSVVHKVIPQYPENLQKQAVIKIRFTVLPNGQVGEMLPVIKSDALLEKITLDALRQWRFNPLSPEAEQRTEKGVITFRYLLK